jgi:hypothetical protein
MSSTIFAFASDSSNPLLLEQRPYVTSANKVPRLQPKVLPARNVSQAIESSVTLGQLHPNLEGISLPGLVMARLEN